MDDFSKNSDEMRNLPFGFRRKPLDGRIEEKNWNEVEASIRVESAVVVGMEVGKRRSFRWIRPALAAASIAVLAFGIWRLAVRTRQPEEMAVIRTGFGEIKNVLLPDSSVVVLNGNSSMRIPSQWTETGGRQVWLEGEAYFQVQKKPLAAQKFVVHTKEVDVEVLGTRFNVNTRRQRAVVSLEEGKV